MRKNKSYTLNKVISITNIETGKEQLFNTYEAAEKATGISRHILRKIVRGDVTREYKRDKKEKLFRIEIKFDYVCKIRPMFEYEDDAVMFTSAYKCCKFLHISKTSYYKRYKMQDVGVECEKEIHDEFKRPWRITFLKSADGEFNGFNPVKAYESNREKRNSLY